MKRIAIIGGGIAGVTAAWQLARLDPTLNVTLFEASSRLGGTVETIRRDGFVIECGPDGWVTEKPWARELAIELGLESELIFSNDATRVTYILRDGQLVAMPDGMRMMVPTDLAALAGSPLFTDGARAAYAAEPGRAAQLREAAPDHDESVADFVERHFGAEVLHTLAAPLLSGVFGGDVGKLSVRAVMPNFVQMERSHGSLIAALQARAARTAPQSIFTSLRSGTQTLIDSMVEEIPEHWIRLGSPVGQLVCTDETWRLDGHPFDEVIMATPAHVTRRLLGLTDLTQLLPRVESSAIIAAFAFTQDFDLPQGFGFLVPSAEENTLLAGTFVDQKYPDRCPRGMRLLRAFFGGKEEPANDRRSDDQLAAEALADVEQIVGPLPAPAFHVVRRWPRSLPQYAVGHLDRIAELERLAAQLPGLHLVGNAYRGVGLPDLIRDARAMAQVMIAGW